MYDDVYFLHGNLEPKKATGYNNITSKLLKVDVIPLSCILCKLFFFL